MPVRNHWQNLLSLHLIKSRFQWWLFPYIGVQFANAVVFTFMLKNVLFIFRASQSNISEMGSWRSSPRLYRQDDG
jgi:hypothetical protein